MTKKGKILITLAPKGHKQYAELFRPEAEAKLNEVGVVIRNSKAAMSPEEIMRHIENTVAIIGNQPYPKSFS